MRLGKIEEKWKEMRRKEGGRQPVIKYKISYLTWTFPNILPNLAQIVYKCSKSS